MNKQINKEDNKEERSQRKTPIDKQTKEEDKQLQAPLR